MEYGILIKSAEGENQIAISSEDLPELPWERRARYQEIGLNSADADTLVTNWDKGNYFDQVIKNQEDPNIQKKLASIIINELEELTINPTHLGELAQMLISGQIGSKMGKDLLLEIQSTDLSPELIIKEKNWINLSDESSLSQIVATVIKKNQPSVEAYRGGKVAAIGALIGAAMRESQGQANPEVVKRLLEDKLTKNE